MAKKRVPQTREDVLELAIEDIRSRFGEGSIMRLGDSFKTAVDVISTGILPLDVALGIGGLPRGRIIEVFGPEGSGKTTVSLHAIAEAQKAGGVAAFIDAEHALDPRLAHNLGVDVQSLYVAQPDSGEQALYVLDALVRSSAVDIVVGRLRKQLATEARSYAREWADTVMAAAAAQPSRIGQPKPPIRSAASGVVRMAEL